MEPLVLLRRLVVGSYMDTQAAVVVVDMLVLVKVVLMEESVQVVIMEVVVEVVLIAIQVLEPKEEEQLELFGLVIKGNFLLQEQQTNEVFY
jgi:hypothetical protein